ncbi:hypothetical protein [Sinorhizobium medicae]|uniref:hypothetical protein n=1 Tax=Sinorhizobium medicae TaxID=110321 RepID=UPI00041F8BFF|nr:hypothetical protein [Sinorhizobium medicae]RVQ59539.1 hypothetical protein CN244_28895 [Sinorhizobium medicae]
MSRRICIYFSWSRPQEIAAPLHVLDNRYPNLFEFRRAIWPFYEHASDPAPYKQDISGFLDHVILSDFRAFEKVVVSQTGYPVSLIQREGDTPPVKELDDALLADVDTLIVVSLDHFRTSQTASEGEVECIRSFLRRENACLIVCPHHDVGDSEKLDDRVIQHRHHGDGLVPGQQRIGGFAKSLLDQLGFPIENQWGLSPGRDAVGGPAQLLFDDDAMKASGILAGVRTFNLHPHLPHLWVPPQLSTKVSVLARQPINTMAPPHPFVIAGHRDFNAFLHIGPGDERAGHVFVCDATLWSSVFSGMESLSTLWANVANFGTKAAAFTKESRAGGRKASKPPK